MEIIKVIATYCGYFSAIIALTVLIIKPLRQRFIDWITKTSDKDNINTKLDKLTDLVTGQHKQINDISEEMQKQSLALQASLRNSILVIYNKNIEKGWISLYEKENLAKLFEQYKNLGGNSFIYACYQELNNLPVRN